MIYKETKHVNITALAVLCVKTVIHPFWPLLLTEILMTNISKGKVKQEKSNSLEHISKVSWLEVYRNCHFVTNRTEIV